MGKMGASRPIEPEIALYNDSLERCSEHHDFLERFYEVFAASSAEVAEKLGHTSIAQQAILLKASLYVMMMVNWVKPEANAHLERIALVHSRQGLDIRPELYDVWLDCLIATVKEFDPLADAAVERAWRQVLAPGIEFMKSRY